MARRIDGDQNFTGFGMTLPLPSPFQRSFRYFDPVNERSHPYPPVLAPMNVHATVSDFSERSTYSIRPPNYGRVHSISDDIHMTAGTPVLSRAPSRMNGLEPSSNGLRKQEPLCVCNTNFGTDGNGNPGLTLVTNTQPRSGIPINTLLNPITLSCSMPSIPNLNLASSESYANQRLLTPASMSICSTANSASTVGPATHNATEERCYLLNRLYNTCLEATASHVRSPTFTNRSHSRRSARHHPYHNPKEVKRGKREIKPAATLMDNISTICTRVWKKARRDPMAPHREEAAAVREMRDLYVWGEVVARCMESDGLDDGNEYGDSESGVTVLGPGGGGTGSDGVRYPGMKVARAAERLCNWLGDEDVWDTCDTIMEELRDLVDIDGGGGGGSEFGSIL